MATLCVWVAFRYEMPYMTVVKTTVMYVCAVSNGVDEFLEQSRLCGREGW